MALIEELNASQKLTAERREWPKWMRAAAKLREECWHTFGFDPFSYNETAIVGHLVAAAGRAGFASLPEYAEDKTHRSAGAKGGRCDLWLGHAEGAMDWAFEFKRGWMLPGTTTRMNGWLRSAREAAEDRNKEEASKRIAAVAYIPELHPMPTGDYPEIEFTKDSHGKAYSQLNTIIEESDLAYRIDGGSRPVFIVFSAV